MLCVISCLAAIHVLHLHRITIPHNAHASRTGGAHVQQVCTFVFVPVIVSIGSVKVPLCARTRVLS